MVIVKYLLEKHRQGEELKVAVLLVRKGPFDSGRFFKSNSIFRKKLLSTLIRTLILKLE